MSIIADYDAKMKAIQASKVKSSLMDDIESALEILQNPEAVDNGDGTCSIQSDNTDDIDDLNSDSVEKFLDYSRYGDNVQHGSMRHNTEFKVDNGTLYLIDRRK